MSADRTDTDANSDRPGSRPQTPDAEPRWQQRKRRYTTTWAAVGAVLAICSDPTFGFTSPPFVSRARCVTMSATGNGGGGSINSINNAGSGSCKNGSGSMAGYSGRQSISSNALSRNSNSVTMVPSGTRLYADSDQSTPMRLLDQEEFELSVGKAMDTLRSDYPVVLRKSPDFSIYDKNIEVIDPSGVKLHGLSNYRSSFRLMHAIVGIFYCPERSMLTFRMCFDKARQNIRISWNAYVVPKAIFGGEKTTLHVDGISVYELSRVTGNVKQHRIERLVINDSAVLPEKGVVAALRGYAVKKKVDSIPIFNTEGSNPHDGNGLLEFRAFSPFSASSLLFSSINKENSPRLTTTTSLASSSSTLSSGSNSDSNDLNIDWEALEKKNASRKKFGLDPLSPEEFLELQEKVAEIDTQQKERAAAAAAAKMENEKRKSQNKGFLKKLFGDALSDTCESNFDCERPKVCCDFGVVKRCCRSGALVVDGPRSRQGQLAEVPVLANPDNYPPVNYPPRRY